MGNYFGLFPLFCSYSWTEKEAINTKNCKEETDTLTVKNRLRFLACCVAPIRKGKYTLDNRFWMSAEGSSLLLKFLVL